MRGRWSVRPGRLVLAGDLTGADDVDIGLHHHPAVQLTVGLDGPLVVVFGDGRTVRCRVAVIAGGVRHALRPGGARTALSAYINPAGRTGAVLNGLCRRDGDAGVWTAPLDDDMAELVEGGHQAGDLQVVADIAVRAVLRAAGIDPADASPVHPALSRAVELVSAGMPDRADLVAVARAVAVSPDYLGRLFRRQTGVSFSAMARWSRLLSALPHLDRGASVTDAAHLAGFADGAHAHRVCRELAGISPSQVARLLAENRTDPFKRE
ncbi:helix-turn-helix domain-containing protein [Mycobacterium sp. CPCC 205372]|uniref:Helix-turn-helix domain-containing protein n=1 Tax=Mycobacterium hippophais TaxID=3016340 RepID=A0ABT4PYC1_9MYCO|nr:helix-turn-helix domain-containing protein [Mycobacterium hippophais]